MTTGTTYAELRSTPPVAASFPTDFAVFWICDAWLSTMTLSQRSAMSGMCRPISPARRASCPRIAAVAGQMVKGNIRHLQQRRSTKSNMQKAVCGILLSTQDFFSGILLCFFIYWLDAEASHAGCINIFTIIFEKELLITCFCFDSQIAEE